MSPKLENRPITRGRYSDSYGLKLEWNYVTVTLCINFNIKPVAQWHSISKIQFTKGDFPIKMHQNRYRRGIYPGPCWRSYSAPLGLKSSTSHSIHFFIQSLSSFRNTRPYCCKMFCCSTKIMSPISNLPLSSLLGNLSFTLVSHIYLTIVISARWSATSFSFRTGQVSRSHFHATYCFAHNYCTTFLS